MIVTNEFTYQSGSSGVKRNPNPLYNSGSSLDSVCSSNAPKHYNYNEIDRKTINNPTYVLVNGEKEKRSVISNETYNFPEVVSMVNSREITKGEKSNYDICINNIENNHKLTPESDYRDINRRRNSQEFTVKPSLKNYRPTIRKNNITDESIGRRKGTLMGELQKTINKKNNL